MKMACITGIEHRRPWSIIFLESFWTERGSKRAGVLRELEEELRAHTYIYILTDCETVVRLREFKGGLIHSWLWLFLPVLVPVRLHARRKETKGYGAGAGR